MLTKVNVQKKGMRSHLISSLICYLLAHCADFFASAFEAELFDRGVEPASGGAIVHAFAGID